MKEKKKNVNPRIYPCQEIVLSFFESTLKACKETLKYQNYPSNPGRQAKKKVCYTDTHVYQKK